MHREHARHHATDPTTTIGPSPDDVAFVRALIRIADAADDRAQGSTHVEVERRILVGFSHGCDLVRRAR